jgi:hypothetical protein
VLDLERRRLLVHRHLRGGDYADVRELDAYARATAIAVALPDLPIADLVAAADA